MSDPQRKAGLYRGLARKKRLELADLLRRRAKLAKEVNECIVLIEQIRTLQENHSNRDGRQDAQSLRSERYYLQRLTAETETLQNRKLFFEQELEELQKKVNGLFQQSRLSLEKADDLDRLAQEHAEERNAAQIPPRAPSHK